MNESRPVRGQSPISCGKSVTVPGLLLVAAWSLAEAAAPPPPRDRAEVESAIARSPGPPPAAEVRALRVVLVANEKDHGPEEHDYPLWQKRWAALLGGKTSDGRTQVNMYGPPAALPNEAGAPGVRVTTAWGWPSAEELAASDLVIAFIGTGGRWNKDRLADLEAFLGRGGGFVAVHSAVITSAEHAPSLAALIGLAWQDGYTTFRHGPVDVTIAATDHPICLGLPRTLRFEDETYWPLVDDRSKIVLLATAEERDVSKEGSGGLSPQPMFWTFERGRGRVFGAVLGHYTWTFDDPYFRLLLLRGAAWAARESPYRFDALALRGARTGTDAPAPQRPARPPAAPKAPEAGDERLLLWFDASDRSSLTIGDDGLVSAWSNKARAAGRAVTSEGARRPRFAATAIGDKPAVRFDGIDDVLRDTDFSRSATDWTLFVVAAPRSNKGGFRALFTANKEGINDYLSGINLDLGGGPSPLFDTLNLEGAQHQGQSNLKFRPSPFGPAVIAVSHGRGAARAFVNGVAELERMSADTPASLAQIRIGARCYENPPGKLPLLEHGTLDGDIAEVILYGAELADDEREAVTTYLLGKYPAAFAQAKEPTLEDAFKALPAYEIGGGRRTLGPIDEAVKASFGDAAARAALEARLLAALRAADAMPDAKDYVCRTLAVAGTSASIPALAALLPDARLGHAARCAIERIGGAEAAAALAAALPVLAGKAKAGAIDSLGRLGGPDVEPLLARLAEDADAAVAEAAVHALGARGATRPLVLLRAKARGARADDVAHALLAAACRADAEGRAQEAAAIFADLAATGPDGVRAAARRNLARPCPSGDSHRFPSGNR